MPQGGIVFNSEKLNKRIAEIESKLLFEIWMEGYAATGEHGTAQFEGKFYGNNFDEAVESYLQSREFGYWPDIRKYHSVRERDGKNIHAVWGCRLFDNEADARKSFG